MSTSLRAGPELIAILLNWGLFGVLSLQVYIYSQSFSTDKLALKSLVGVLYILEATQTFLMTQTVWSYFVSEEGKPEDIGVTWLSVWVVGGLVALLVQSFYAYRVSVFTRNKLIPGAIIMISIASFGGALGAAVLSIQAKTIDKLLDTTSLIGFPIIAFWAVSCALCDGLIAGLMCYYLRRNNPVGEFSRTQAIVAKLIRMTIETGLLTALTSTLILILYYPSSLKKFTYFLVPLAEHAKLYSTTMMAVLNNRTKFRDTAAASTENRLVFASSIREDSVKVTELKMKNQTIPV
ncbi:hypothetical protein BDN70DRAFT_936271 [Pholiota conissans]|uniref:DUF6534 domain-containing protein n=1 Tax=Pholiota conissans TaxID=109636 RepID=A0A9P5YUG0_9AGAR|nr:hypothetical protein BDN70DRAFT_936271 [Pholiota conissans]